MSHAVRFGKRLMNFNQIRVLCRRLSKCVYYLFQLQCERVMNSLNKFSSSSSIVSKLQMSLIVFVEIVKCLTNGLTSCILFNEMEQLKWNRFYSWIGMHQTNINKSSKFTQWFNNFHLHTLLLFIFILLHLNIFHSKLIFLVCRQ